MEGGEPPRRRGRPAPPPPPEPHDQLDRIRVALNEIQGQARRNLHPPVYSEAESFRSFCRKLNDFLNANQYTREDARRMLPLALTGHARDVYDDIPVQIRNHGTWEELLTELNNRINSDDRRLTARSKLASLRQGDKSVQAYAQECKEVATKAFPADEGAREEILLQKFLGGLSNRTRRAVYKTNPHTFREALEKALQEEALDKMEDPDAIANAIADLTVSVNALQERQAQWRERTPERNQQQSSYHYQGPYQQQDGNNQQREWRPYTPRISGYRNGRHFYRQPRGQYPHRGSFRGRGGFRGRGNFRGNFNGSPGRRVHFGRVNSVIDPTVADPTGEVNAIKIIIGDNRPRHVGGHDRTPRKPRTFVVSRRAAPVFTRGPIPARRRPWTPPRPRRQLLPIRRFPQWRPALPPSIRRPTYTYMGMTGPLARPRTPPAREEEAASEPTLTTPPGRAESPPGSKRARRRQRGQEAQQLSAEENLRRLLAPPRGNITFTGNQQQRRTKYGRHQPLYHQRRRTVRTTTLSKRPPSRHTPQEQGNHASNCQEISRN